MKRGPEDQSDDYPSKKRKTENDSIDDILSEKFNNIHKSALSNTQTLCTLNNVHITISGSKDKSEKINFILDKLKKNAKVTELLHRLLKKEGSIEIKFRSAQSDPGLQFGGYCMRSLVVIDENLDDLRLLATVIFELCNLDNDKLFGRKVDDYLNITNGREKYAKDTEIAESDTFIQAKKIYLHGVQHHNYPSSFMLNTFTSYVMSEKNLSKLLSYLPGTMPDLFGVKYLDQDIDTTLRLMDKKPYIFWGRSHTDLYRNQWDKANEEDERTRNIMGWNL
ncbi:MAG: hypothetical protein JSS07_00940 [Proteobacteria bacterium]|nr:hypothetical protein [Pseudomonadota bacterium]